MEQPLPDRNQTDTAEATCFAGKSLSVFFPCYNEEGTVETLTKDTVDVVRSVTDDFEVIIVNDGSSDRTAEIVQKLADEIEEVKLVNHEVNSGYGAALQTGFKSAAKEYVFYTDGDGQFDIKELPGLLPLSEKYDIVSAYRVNRQEGALRKLNAFCWGTLVCILFKMKVRDIDCAFKLYKRDIFNNIKMKSTGALIDSEILARATKKGYTIGQIGVKHYPRLTGVSTGAKISVIIRAFRELFQLRKEIMKG